MLNSNCDIVNSYEENEKNPDYKRALEICSILFHNAIYRKGNFNYQLFISVKGTIKIILNKYGLEAFEYFQKEILDNHLEAYSDSDTFNPLYVLKFCEQSKEKIKQFKKDKQIKSIEENNIDNTSSSLIPNIYNNNRIIPNAFLRSSLFGLIKKGKRKMVKENLIFSFSQYKILFTGEELDQLDLVVWDTLVFLFKQKNQIQQKDIINFSLYEICKVLGYRNNLRIKNQVKERINRLKYANVRIDFNKCTYIGSLINSLVLDELNDIYSLEMNKKLIYIFSNQKDYTYIKSEIRNLLGQNQLAHWLFHFYSSNSKPIPFKIEYIKQLSGSNSTEKEFNRLIQNSLKTIKKAYETENIEFNYNIKNKELFVDISEQN